MTSSREKRRWCGVSSILLILTIGVLLSLNVFVVRASAQINGAGVSGVVTNDLRLPVPSAKVSARNVKNGAVQFVITNGGGYYALSDLSPESYEITVSLAGFKTQVLLGVSLAVGEHRSVNVTLNEGSPTEIDRSQAPPRCPRR